MTTRSAALGLVAGLLFALAGGACGGGGNSTGRGGAPAGGAGGTAGRSSGGAGVAGAGGRGGLGGGAGMAGASTAGAGGGAGTAGASSGVAGGVGAADGELRVVIEAAKTLYGSAVYTGPAGTVFVQGWTSANLDGTHSFGQDTCFVAKLTASLAFEWVHQYPSCIGRAAVGPTGNVFMGIYTGDISGELQILSFSPSGTIRSGFPITVGPVFANGGHVVRALAVNGQDDVLMLAYREAVAFDPLWQINSRTYLAAYTTAGTVKQALGLVDFKDTVTEYDHPLDIALSSAGDLWITANFEERPAGPGIMGTFVLRFDSSGAAPGFPIRLDDAGGVTSRPLALAPLPASSDVVALGTGRGSSQTPTFIRYQDTGVVAAGFPKDLTTGSSKTFYRDPVGPLVTDGQGNAYLLARLEDPADSGDVPEYVVLSYTRDGVLRAGYPIHIGVDAMNGIAVDGAGTIYTVGSQPNADPGRDTLVVLRLPAR